MSPTPSITAHDIHCAFMAATHSVQGAAERWARDAGTGLSTPHLTARLRFELGAYGGCSPARGTQTLTVEYAADNLAIWASHDGLSRHRLPPVLAGNATIAYARQTFAITDPEASQLTLF